VADSLNTHTVIHSLYGHFLDEHVAFTALIAFSALTLLLGIRMSIRPVKMSDEVLVWLSVWNEV